METELCKLAYKYGTDKCPQIGHEYTPFYYDLFNHRKDEIKKVVELGIGNSEHLNRKGRNTKETPTMGASLYMWRDFFPNAQIYGADCFPETHFEAERIKTIQCDERKKEDLRNLIKQTGSDIDIFIDDALHRTNVQIFVAKIILPLLDKDATYIIEDCKNPHGIAEHFQKHVRQIVMFPKNKQNDNNLVIIKK